MNSKLSILIVLLVFSSLSVAIDPLMLGEVLNAEENHMLNEDNNVSYGNESDFCGLYQERDSSGRTLRRKPLLIYVYNMPNRFTTDTMNIQKKNKSCFGSMYESDVIFHQMLVDSELYVTTDPLKADFFYVPVYGTCQIFKKWSMSEGKKLYGEAVRYVIDKHPYFNRSFGADHVWPFSYDLGPKIAPYEEIRNGIFLSIDGSLEGDHFTIHKDIILPPHITRREEILEKLDQCNQKSGEKEVLAYFRGVLNLGKEEHEANAEPRTLYSRGIRQKLYRNFLNDEEIVVRAGHDANYHCEMKQATFCLCPPGFMSWSPRIFESLLVGCVPVIISDDIMLPFEEEFDYRKFTLKLPEKDIYNIRDILKKIPRGVIERKRKAGFEIFDNFLFHRNFVQNDATTTRSIDDGWKRPDSAFCGILRALQRRAPKYPISFGRTWR